MEDGARGFYFRQEGLVVGKTVDRFAKKFVKPDIFRIIQVSAEAGSTMLEANRTIARFSLDTEEAGVPVQSEISRLCRDEQLCISTRTICFRQGGQTNLCGKERFYRLCR